MASAVLAVALFAGLQLPASASHAPDHPCDLIASTKGIDVPGGGQTAEDPLRTVQALVDGLAPGQTGCLRGTEAASPFSESVTIASKNPSGGSESDRITLMSYPGEVAKIRGRLVIESSANLVTVKQVVLEGTASGPAARLEGDDLRITDSNITNPGGVCLRAGVLDAGAERLGLLRNRIRDCKSDAFYLGRTTWANLQGNLIYDNGGYGIRLSPDARGSYVYRNVLDGNAHGVVFFGDSASRLATANFLDRNIISRSANWNIGYVSMASSAFNMVSQTCVFSVTKPDGGLQSTPSPKGYAIWAPPLPVSDPGYVDRDSGDFHPADPADPCFRYSGDVAADVDGGGGPNDEEATADNPLPNILFIVTDDQRADGTVTPEVMPEVVSRLRQGGVDFTNAFVTTPSCCPSRATIMTGRYIHNHEVYAGAWAENMPHDSSLQAYLKQHSQHPYRTAVFGKFLNQWDLDLDPPHWDEWGIFNDEYCPFVVNENGARKRYPALDPATGGPPVGECAPADLGKEGHEALAPYSTHYVRDHALEFLEHGEADDETDSRPWFLYVAPYAPHGARIPEAEHANDTFPPYPGNPATFEDTSDKPPVPGFGATTFEETFGDPGASPPTPGRIVEQQRTLRSVDDMVARLLDELKRKGEQDTLVVFVSDNGYMWGEHGMTEKQVPYLHSVQVPLLMRYAPITTPGKSDSRLVANIDLVPTALELAGVSPPTDPPLDGQSLIGSTTPRTRLHTELNRQTGAEWAATRAPGDYLYIERYLTDGKTVQFREYYDLAEDPYELTNLYGPDGQPGTLQDPGDDLGIPDYPVEVLEEVLRRDRHCEGSACSPGPGSADPQDTHPPRTLVTAPRLGSTVCCRVMLKAEATDNVGVQQVEFRVDGNVVGTDSTRPYSTVWDSAAYAEGSHTIEAIAVDTAADPNVPGSEGNRTPAGSPGSSVDVDLDKNGFDVQIDDGGVPRTQCGSGPPPCNVATVNDGDIVTFTFPGAISPESIAPGWDGVEPADCSGSPPPPGCVTVGIRADSKVDQFDNDVLAVYENGTGSNPLTAVPIPVLGSVDLGDFNYIGFDTGIPLRTWPGSKAAVSGNTVTIKLGPGMGAPLPGPPGTTVWTNPTCGCEVWESIDGADTAEDVDF